MGTKSAQVYYCQVCGYGYADQKTADECQAYCSTHASCSLIITAKAIRKPADSDEEGQNALTTSRGG